MGDINPKEDSRLKPSNIENFERPAAEETSEAPAAEETTEEE